MLVRRCNGLSVGSEVSSQGLVGQHAVIWMKNYFGMHCDVMPTTGRLHL